MVTLPDKPIPREFVNLAGPAMLPHTSGILTAVLPCLAYEDEERRMVREVYFSLKKGELIFSSLFLFFSLILKSLPLWAERGGLCEWPIIVRKRMKVTVVVLAEGKICVAKACWCQTPKVIQ